LLRIRFSQSEAEWRSDVARPLPPVLVQHAIEIVQLMLALATGLRRGKKSRKRFFKMVLYSITKGVFAHGILL